MTNSHAASPTASSMSGMSMTTMNMVFQNSHNAPLFSSSWQPTSTGAYAGTCIFLIVLATLLRGLYAGKHILEQRWHDKALERRYVRVQGTPTEAERIDADADSSYGTLVTARGKEESVKVVTHRSRPVMPWRLTVDLPRALYTTLTAGIGYLLYVPSFSYLVLLSRKLTPAKQDVGRHDNERRLLSIRPRRHLRGRACSGSVCSARGALMAGPLQMKIAMRPQVEY